MTDRFAIPDFALANPMYVGALVSFYTVALGVKTDTLAPLFLATTGVETARNPHRLDSFGKFYTAIYADQAVIAVVSGLGVPDHETGIIRSLVGTPSLRMALVYPLANIVNPAYPYTIVFDAENRDTDAIHSLVLNPSRLTVPAGVTSVRLRGHVKWTASVALNAGVKATIKKNGASPYIGIGEQVATNGNYTDPGLAVESAILAVVPGDYFELAVDTTDAVSVIDAAQTWFQMEILE